MANLSKWTPFRFDRRANGITRSDQRHVPRDPFEAMHRDMNQLMRAMMNDDWLAPSMRVMTQTPSWFGNFAPAKFSPSVDVFTEGNHLVVSAELPGMTKEDVKVTVNDGVMTLAGEKKHEFENEEEGCFRTERFFGSFKRTVPLPVDVKTEAAEARFDNGVLTVKFPKVEEETPEEVEIQLG